MKVAYYIKSQKLVSDTRVMSLLERLQAGGCSLYRVNEGNDLEDDTSMILALGGDGTFLSASHLAAPEGLPLLGVNFGHLGFLSENSPEDVLEAILSGAFDIEERTMLQARSAAWGGKCLYALNEVSVSRVSAKILAVDVEIDGRALPTYRADGLLVSTSSGSTAYSLSAGGPICTPDSRVLILAPVAPHNLNMRPIVVPENTRIVLHPSCNEGSFVLNVDNMTFPIHNGDMVEVGPAPFKLRRVITGKFNFIEALKSRLLWGGDVRNNMDYK